MLLASVGGAVALVTHDLRGAALGGLVAVAGIILRPTSMIAALPPTVALVLSILVHGWLTASVAAIYLLNWVYSWIQHRQRKQAGFRPQIWHVPSPGRNQRLQPLLIPRPAALWSPRCTCSKR